MTNKTLTLGSLFDGSGGFPLGGLLAGITPVWASEIEPFPIRVTTKRLPFMKYYGNISAMDGGKIEPVDIITFGSPCQDMSIAGRRDGLDGSRSSLFYEAVRIIKEMRCASEDAASTLSQILQAEVPEKYYLSQKACLGILRRASARGKELPEVLRLALERQAMTDTTAV